MRQLSALLMAVGAHGAIFVAEVGGGSLAMSADARQEITLVAAEFIELDGQGLLAGDEGADDSMPEAEPEPAVEPAPSVKKERPRRTREPAREAPAPAPTEEITPVTSSEALDLTSFRIAAPAKPSASGSSDGAADGEPRAVSRGGVHGGRGHGHGGGRGHGKRGFGGSDAHGNLSAQIAIANRRWRCPWPFEADRLAIHRESATIRVCVTSDGTLDSAEIRHDPGHGFGASALQCAEKARFTPARDVSGAALDACATIRVRFER